MNANDAKVMNGTVAEEPDAWVAVEEFRALGDRLDAADAKLDALRVLVGKATRDLRRTGGDDDLWTDAAQALLVLEEAGRILDGSDA